MTAKNGFILADSHRKGLDVMKKSVKTSIVLAVMMGSAFYMPALNSVYAAETVEITTQEEFDEKDKDGSLKLTGSNNNITISNVESYNKNAIDKVNEIKNVTAGTGNDNHLTVTNSSFNQLYGSRSENGVSGNIVTVNGNNENNENNYGFVGIKWADNDKVYTVAGGLAEKGKVSNNEVHINGGTFIGDIAGGAIAGANVVEGEGDVEYNKVFISNGNFTTGIVHGVSYEITGDIYGGVAGAGNARFNEVNITGGTFKDFSIYGAHRDGDDNAATLSYNKVSITGNANLTGDLGSINGAYANIYAGKSDTDNNTIYIGADEDGNTPIINKYNRIIAGDGSNAKENSLIIKGGTIKSDGINYLSGAEAEGEATDNSVSITNASVSGYNVIGALGKGSENKVYIAESIIDNGTISGCSGTFLAVEEANNNIVEISGGNDKTKITNTDIYGAYGKSMTGNEVKLSGGIIGSADEIAIIAAARINTDCKATDNKIVLQNDTDVSNAKLYGIYTTDEKNEELYPDSQWYDSEADYSSCSASGNSLNIDGWTGSTQSVKRFNVLDFSNLEWKDNDTVLTITNGAADDLKDTEINISSIKNGNEVAVGESMTLIHSNNDLGTIDDLAKGGKTVNTNSGVATAIEGILEQSDANNVVMTFKEIKLADQTMLVAENRAVAAAFVNQGTDLIADSLDTLSRDGKYGVKTFAAVQGNRSKYDVNSDIKINGWSTIVGVGAENKHNGGDFSWGVFYENGSGNYRTFNEFNNEFFRGDGSLVYNGGGIAARYENAHGVYTEGSLRAGMLKSDMDNALSDGENKYGYSSESEYYGAHIGIGQIIPLSESSDLDVYGKFFHTYTEGDSFKVDTDEFEFDSINSDRLRVGARLTTNKENKFSTYYGLAYEYEFNGDAEMRAAGMSAPTQSLQGSSYMAEVGFNYQPTPESPWSFDLNMRGYAGEREGATFNVQATYTF